MSSSLGQVRFIQSGKIFFFRYDSTGDYCDRVIFETLKAYDQALEEYSQASDNQKLDCDPSANPFETDAKPMDLEPVEIATCYAGGFWWKGLACLKTMTIDYRYTGLYDDFELKEQDGLPSWWLDTD